jgi:unsaturated rhamnogalacturonyl hydrolase
MVELKKAVSRVCFAVLATGYLSNAACAQMTANERVASVGDAPPDPGPLSTDLSPELKPAAIQSAMRRVADWQTARVADTPSQDWTFAALYAGLLSASETLKEPKYRDLVANVADHYKWTLGPRQMHADDQAIGQSYLWLNAQSPSPAHMQPLQQQFDAVMQVPDDPEKPVWWWCDALFMAPPVLAKLSKESGDRKYLDYMDREWWITSNLLYSTKDHLYFRDKTFLTAHEHNGKSVFWSRGNGWVFAGLVRVLAEMPADYPSRPRYVAQFREMAEKIASLQGQDGLWRPGLLDQASYQLPEDSGSAFFAYGFAYGINSGILEKRKYKPVVQKAWRGLLSHVYQDGRLGCIQPIGAAPGAFGPSSSYVYGTGAFLLAGSEIFRLAQ